MAKIEDARNFYRAIIEKSLDEVKNFIIQKKRLLVGGMMIDMALREKGDQLYPDDELPDYDFISPDFHADAYDIGARLNRMGLPNVDCINGMHSATMRVRVNFIPVADITFVPKKVYDKIPFIASGKMRIVHPHYQMMDQHSAINRPFSHDNVEFRWKKDMARFDMLYQYYPVTPKKITDPLKKFELTKKQMKGQCVGGFVGLMLLQEKAKKLGFKPKMLGSVKVSDGKISGESYDVVLHSDNLWDVMKKFNGKVVWYSEFLEKLPRSVVVDDVKILDNQGRQIGASKSGDYWILGTQGLCLYFMANLIRTKKEQYAHGYVATVELVKWAAAHQDLDVKEFLPLVEVFGEGEISDLLVFNLHRMAVLFGDVPRSSFTPKPVFFRETKEVPSKYYDFDPMSSDLYRYDGEETAPFEPIDLPEIGW